MMGDASNSGWLQISKHQALKIMSKYCWADVQSKEGAFTQCTTRISPRMALVVDACRWAKIAARCRLCLWCGPPTGEMEARLAGTREAIRLGSCSLRRIVSSKDEHLLRRRSQGLETHLSGGLGVLEHAGDEVDEFTHGALSMTKEVLHAWADVFNNVAVNYVSSCRPCALTSRWYPVTDVERPADKSAFGCIIRLLAVSQNIGCVPKGFFSEKRAQATPNQRMPLATHLNMKDMLTAIDTAETFNGTLAQFQTRESWWEREVMKNFNVLAFHFCHACFAPVSGASESSFHSVSVSLTRSVAVNRELPSRVPLIESVCSAAEAVFIEYYTLLEKTWAVGLPTRLLYVMCQGLCR